MKHFENNIQFIQGGTSSYFTLLDSEPTYPILASTYIQTPSVSSDKFFQPFYRVQNKTISKISPTFSLLLTPSLNSSIIASKLACSHNKNNQLRL